MAIITVSNTGGNWNATGTWVGGVLPLTTDTIAYTSTSGSLTVNVASICAGMDMTNYSAGKTITFTSTLTINGNWNLGSGAYTQAGASGVIMPVSATITSNGVTWSRTLTFQGTSQTYTLAGNDLTVSGLLTLSPVTTMVWSGAFNINVLGGLTVSGTAGATISGASTPIIIKGGTWNHTVVSYIQNAITINPSTTVTLGVQYVSSPTLTYTAGVGSVITGTGTLNINASTTLNTSGMTWNNVTIIAAITTTLSSTLNATTLQINNFAVTFSGTSGFNVGTFIGSAIAGKTITFASTITYTITSTISITSGTTALPNILKSSIGGSQAILKFSGTSQGLNVITVTDINSSGGNALYVASGTLSNATNWNTFSTLYFVSGTNWGGTGWSRTDGGSIGYGQPSTTDDAYFTSNSGNCTLNVAGLCKTLIFSGVGAGNYSGAFTLTNNVSVYGNVTLASTMTITGTLTLTVNATATLTSNGNTWTGALTLTGTTSTFTFADNWQINGSFNNATSNNIINGGGSILSVGGNVSFSQGASGNIIINMNGTGTLAGINCSIAEIRFAGTITFPGITTNTTTYTYVSGTVTISGAITQITGTGITFNNCGTLTFGTLSFNPIVCTITLSGTNPNINFSTITIAAASAVTWAGTGNITCGTLNLNSNGNFTLIAGKSFTINTAFTSIAGTSAAHTPIKSSVGGTKAILTLTQGASQNLGFVNFTDIDASLGKTIGTFNGTIATSNNVRLLPTDVQTISY